MIKQKQFAKETEINILLEAKNVKKYLGKKEVLKDINLTIDEGEFIALLGESGAGKTTLLRCIAGLEILNGGQILFRDDRVIGPEGRLVPGHKSIAIVQQDFDLFANHNIFDLIEFKLRGYDDEYITTKIADLLNIMGISGFARKHLYEISGGEHQRVAIAQALAGEPSLLLFDESFSHLDSRNTRMLFTEVIRLIKEMDISVLFATHQTELALAYADKIAVMQAGNVIQVDKPSVVYDTPVSVYAAELFGEINQLKPPFVEKSKGIKKLYIRPENIKLEVKDGVLCKVIDQRYIGGRYRIQLKPETGPVLIAYHTNELTLTQVNVSFDQKKILEL